jgi:2-oxoglutarate dehydrogenase E2 component (dihydrolipoamide succinyltransferase)
MSIEIKVPSMGESITEAYVGQWYKKEGESIDEDENLVELESEKATFDVPAPVAGVIEKILKKNGDTAEVGEVIGYIDDSKAGKKDKKKDKETDRGKPSGKDREDKPDRARRKDQPHDADEADAEPSKKRPKTGARVMPAARRALDEHGLREEDVEASGPGGRLLKEDVLRHVEGGRTREVRRPVAETEEEEAGFREEEVVPMSPIRRRIAERLVRAQQNAALLTTFNEIDMSAVMDLRTKHRDAFREKYGVKLGFMSFFVKGVVEALKAVPQVNGEVRGSDIVYRNYYDIGVAVGGGKGLVVPVLRNAETMSFAEIEQAIDDLSRRARPGEQARNSRARRRHVHDQQRRHLRVPSVHAHRQSAPERRSRHARDPGAARGARRGGRRPPDDVCRPHLRSPHRRRPRSGHLPAPHQGNRRRTRPHPDRSLIAPAFCTRTDCIKMTPRSSGRAGHRKVHFTTETRRHRKDKID